MHTFKLQSNINLLYPGCPRLLIADRVKEAVRHCDIGIRKHSTSTALVLEADRLSGWLANIFPELT